MTHSTTIGILGAGKLGITLAQLAVKAGYTVYISGSGASEKIQLSVSVIAPGAIASTNAEAVKHSDVVILAMPLSKFKSIPSELLENRLVIDSMNYWWEIDGTDSEFNNARISSSEMVQQYFNTARIVKAFSHMGYHHLSDEALPVENTHRKAIAIAGEYPVDTIKVSQIVSDLGFDPLLIGGLSEGVRLEPGQPAFGANVDKHHLQTLIGMNINTLV